jgi:hypothetical protein
LVACGGTLASVVVVEEGIPASFGITGPGTLKASTSGASRGTFLCKNESVPVLGHRTSKFLLCTLLLVCMCTSVPELYIASMPSGMITTKDVPTRTPIPIVEIRRNCDEERVMDNGNAPARKDLDTVSKFSHTPKYAYAKAITTLRTSNRNSPSNIFTP